MIDSSRASLARWKDALWNTYVRLESKSDSPAFYGNVTEELPGSNCLTEVVSTTQITQRTFSNIRHDPQEYILVAFQVEGEGYAEQGDRQAKTTPGDFVLYESTHPYTLVFSDSFKQRVLKLPLQTLDRRIPRLSSIVGRTINGRDGAGAIARQFVSNLAARGAELPASDYAIYADIAADLIAYACLGQVGTLSSSAIRFERLRARLKRLVRAPAPDIEQFAKSESMSLRSLHRLFQLNGTTPREVILNCRLDGALRDLSSPIRASQSIGEIAFSWGFTDQSYFNREFRRRFGKTPGEMRSLPR